MKCLEPFVIEDLLSKIDSSLWFDYRPVHIIWGFGNAIKKESNTWWEMVIYTKKLYMIQRSSNTSYCHICIKSQVLRLLQAIKTSDLNLDN